jgi:hypothetical protein
VLTYPALRTWAGLDDGRIAALAGTAIAAVLIVAMLFDSRLSTPGVLVLAAIATVALYALLSAIAAPLDWDRVSAQSWITTTTLTSSAAGDPARRGMAALAGGRVPNPVDLRKGRCRAGDAHAVTEG